MKHISKLDPLFSRRGNKVVRNVIDSHWQTNRYIHFRYNIDELHELRKILVEEQGDGNPSEGYCCYCMRKIYSSPNDNHTCNVTLEHIIPQNISQESWKADGRKYRKYSALSSKRVKVCINGELSDETIKIKRLPYPHFLSYHNLVASCDGKIFDGESLVPNHCCNTYRGEKYIEPFYLDPNISGRISYDPKGNLIYDDELYKHEWFDNNGLNLTCLWLRMVRRFWFKMSQSGYTVADVCNDELRYDILDDIADKGQPQWYTFYKVDKSWEILKEYSWFYYYYKQKYA